MKYIISILYPLILIRYFPLYWQFLKIYCRDDIFLFLGANIEAIFQQAAILRCTGTTGLPVIHGRVFLVPCKK